MQGFGMAFPPSHYKGQSQGLNLSLKSLEQSKSGSPRQHDSWLMNSTRGHKSDLGGELQTRRGEAVGFSSTSVSVL